MGEGRREESGGYDGTDRKRELELMKCLHQIGLRASLPGISRLLTDIKGSNSQSEFLYLGRKSQAV